MSQQLENWTQEKKNAVAEQVGCVAVFMGGDSAEREVSLKSGKEILAALTRVGVNAIGVDATRNNLETFSFEAVDRVFLAMHGRGGEDGTMQGYLEMRGIPYTGSGILASSLAMDKARTKQLWIGQGLKTPSFMTMDASLTWTDVSGVLGGSVCIKPAHEGSSIGVHKVTDEHSFATAMADATTMDSEVLAESWVSGKEYTVAILKDDVLPVIGLSTEHEFYDFDAKYVSDDTGYQLPSGLSAEKEIEIKALALMAFKAVGCKSWGRVDVMADENDDFWLLEINTIPGMTDHSLVPMAAKAAGIEFDELVLRILADTLNEPCLS